GGWPSNVRPLLDVSYWYAVPCLTYVILVVFAALRLITALFVRSTLQVLAKDAGQAVLERLQQTAELQEKLVELFCDGDMDGDRALNLDEWRSLLSHKEILQYMSVLEVDVHDAETLFHLLDDGDGVLTFSEFCEGIPKIRGPARSLDIIALQRLGRAFLERSEGEGILLDLRAKASAMQSLEVEPGEPESGEVCKPTSGKLGFRDLGNVGLVLHFFSQGFTYGGMNAILIGVFAAYLNVPSHISNAGFNVANLPNVFLALMGAISDSRPILGLHRRPYMALGWCLTFLSFMVMAWLGLPAPYYCHAADGTYDYTQEPCNPKAATAYVSLMVCLFLTSVGLCLSSAAGNGLMVQYAKAEPEAERGRAQAQMNMVNLCGQFAGVSLAAFGFNGRLFSGSFDQRTQMGFSQYCTVFVAVAGVTSFFSGLYVREPLMERSSLRSYCHDSLQLMESKAFGAIGLYFFLSSSIFLINTNATVWVMLEWAQVKMLQKQLFSLLGVLVSLFGTWLTQKYLLQCNWRTIIVATTLATVALDSVPQFLTIFDVIRNQYFYLGEPITSNVPVAMSNLVQTFLVNEVADESNCALVSGLVMSIASVGQPLAILLGNQIFTVFHPSLTERQNYIEDAPSFRRTVALSYVVSYGFSLGPGQRKRGF
ncbi:unnamed protein product, partial [Effrenium voratum]